MQPITKPQSDLLAKLGRTEGQPKSKEEASNLINKLLTVERANRLRDKVQLLNFEEIGVDKQVEESVYVYCKVLLKCVQLEIYEPPVIGMIYNQTMAKL